MSERWSDIWFNVRAIIAVQLLHWALALLGRDASARTLMAFREIVAELEDDDP